jgi:hypothetical protein
MYKTSLFIDEINKTKSNNNNSPTSKNSPVREYSLKQSFFDPAKNSPPNEFMIKLYMRDDLYNIKCYKPTDYSNELKCEIK